jgi:hypothetical protein
MNVLLAALAFGLVPSPPAQAAAPTAERGAPAVTQHFTGCPHRTGASAVVVVPTTATVATTSGPLQVGDEIAVMAPDGSCAGAGVWDGDGLAVTVWEDDPFTPERDGLLAGDPLTFVTYDASEGVAHTFAQVEFEQAYGEGGAYSRDALFVVTTTLPSSVVEPAAPEFALDPNYPNPVRDGTTLPFSLDERGPVALEVFDALGRLVARPVAGDLEAGAHAVALDASALAPGLYVYRLSAGGEVRQRALTVVR